MLLHQDWTDDVCKKIFMIADAPGHGELFVEGRCRDYYPDGSPEGIQFKDLMQECYMKDIDFTFIKLNANCEQMISKIKEYNK